MGKKLNYIESIVIEPQDSAIELAKAATMALAGVLGWSADLTSSQNAFVWQKSDNSGVHIGFSTGATGTTLGSYIYTNVGNSTLSNTNTSFYTAWATGTYYRLYYCKTSNSIAYGLCKDGDTPVLATICAKNTDGTYKVLQNTTTASTSTGSAKFWYIGEEDVTAKSYYVPNNIAAGVSTSIVKAPDIWGGCMFADLFVLFSCPTVNNDMVLYIDGEYYRSLSFGNNCGFALKVG